LDWNSTVDIEKTIELEQEPSITIGQGSPALSKKNELCEIVPTKTGTRKVESNVEGALLGKGKKQGAMG